MDHFDRLIDEAARELVRHEPSDALTTAVMERVTRTRFTGVGGRRWVLSGFAAATAIAALVIVARPDRRPRGVPEQRAPVSLPRAFEKQPVVQHAAEAAENIARETRGPSRMTEKSPQQTLEAINPPDPVEAITVSLISISPIGRPDQIAIEPIDIQPLAAAND